MKIGKGVEWAAHSCALLAALPSDAALPLETLASFIDVPPPYLAKQMQMLSRAKLVATKRGVTGGYRLARLPETISLWDITAALEGTAPSFRCTEIRQNGPCGATQNELSGPCKIAASFAQAEDSFRQTLQQIKLTELVGTFTAEMSNSRKSKMAAWLKQNASLAQPKTAY